MVRFKAPPSGEELFNNVVKPYLLNLARQRLETGTGIPGYASEPKYAAYKQALTGDLRPLRWLPGQREQLAPSLMFDTSPFHLSGPSPNGGFLGSNAPNAKVLDGGVNQFGETYPARNPYALNEAQQQELLNLIKRYTEARWNS